MQYSINTITNKITSGESLGANFRRGDWRLCTETEITDFLLFKNKEEKINQLKKNRDIANTKPINSIQAEEIDLDDNFQETFTGNNVYFYFSVAATGQPATEPNTLILAILQGSAFNPNYYIRYSSKIVDGENLRDGYIKLDASTAINIQAHIQTRATTNIAYCNKLEKQINAATTIEEVEAIDINFS